MQVRKFVQEAKEGNQEAFAKLVQEHRAQAINWAQAITHDPYLAEDVVQDVIVRSYLHLEQLDHPDRFLPWFRSMVRHKAIDYIRKDSKRMYIPDERFEQVDEGLDHPELLLEYQDWLDAFNELCSTLSTRDQQIFQAHFLRQIPPEQIATTFNIKTSNVYTIISRAKVKLQEEAFKQEVANFSRGRSGKKELHPPRFHSSYTSLGHTLHEVYPYLTHHSLPLEEMMGYTGQAFRIQVAEDIGVSSSMIYDWDWVIRQFANSFGLKVRTIGRPGRVPTPNLLSKALNLIHDSIDRGIPAIVWNLTTSEFGLVYGYDIANQRFTYRNVTNTDIKVPYQRLGRSTGHPELFVATLERISETIDFKQTITHLVNHAKGIEPNVHGYIPGLNAYNHWVHVFQNSQVDRVGHTYQVALLTEAREQAVRFLEQFPKTHQAAEYFRKALDVFKRLYPSFPYGFSDINMNIDKHTLNGLKRIKEYETLGYEILEKKFLPY